MNEAQIHLLLNHIPVLGSLFGLILLIIALWKDNHTLLQTALITFMVAAAVVLPVDWSGEGAEEIMEAEGVSHEIIHEHEELAELSVGLMLSLGGIAALTLWLTLMMSALSRLFGFITLLLALLTSVSMAVTAHSGGEIRHTEIREGYQPEKGQHKGEHEEEEHH